MCPGALPPDTPLVRWSWGALAGRTSPRRASAARMLRASMRGSGTTRGARAGPTALSIRFPCGREPWLTGKTDEPTTPCGAGSTSCFGAFASLDRRSSSAVSKPCTRTSRAPARAGRPPRPAARPCTRTSRAEGRARRPLRLGTAQSGPRSLLGHRASTARARRRPPLLARREPADPAIEAPRCATQPGRIAFPATPARPYGGFRPVVPVGMTGPPMWSGE